MLNFRLMAKKKSSEPQAGWRFTDKDERFEASHPETTSRLYFPLCNEAGLLSAITPQLQGDIKTGQNHFLTQPLSSEDLYSTRVTRQFWVTVDGKAPWPVATERTDKSELKAGALYHSLSRECRRLGLRAEITNFVPATSDRVELMKVTLTNTSRKPFRITATAAIPLFARSADNLRDHRHVTSLLHRIRLHAHGVLVTPTMSFDERGHQLNSTTYAVLGSEGDGAAPQGSFPTIPSFIGEGGDLDHPRAILEDWDTPELSDPQLQGREAIGALRFKSRKLNPGQSATYLLILGIAEDTKEIDGWVKRYCETEKVDAALTTSQAYWKERLDAVQIHTDNADFNRWTRWVTLQPMLRKIFGCSFLPDFDYGRGGRGWRDLWQDCLALLLLQPESARSLLLNNYCGVRISGTNATIIGKAPGEFIADRNNISRTWMDHGVWPWITTDLYIQQTGDWKVLLEEVSYFWDRDTAATTLAEKGTLLEHVLVQHLTSYFNVGEHGNCRLEDADWNDGLDMAHGQGESVAFTAVYAGNLMRLSSVLATLKTKGVTHVTLAQELQELLESKMKTTTLGPHAKQTRLNTFREKTKAGVSGQKILISIDEIISDLNAKGTALTQQVRDREWLSSKTGQRWFNGYYDNHGKRVEGDCAEGLRMTLTGQVFPIMSGTATDDQVTQTFAAAKKFLQDKKLGGFRLNTDFGDIQPTLGRAFSFAYGEKENGAFFSHMIVMFANALYQRGFVKEGFEVLSSLFEMCMKTEVAKIYPGLPEYINGEGRGLYHYLTGSASWFVFTMVTQVLGIRGEWGDLLLAPKLMPEQFGASGQVKAVAAFAGKRLLITYVNRGKVPYGKYGIESALVHGRSYPLPQQKKNTLLIPRSAITGLSASTLEITITLA